MKLDWAGRSLADLNDLEAHIRAHNPTAAARVFNAIKGTAARLRRYPRAGPPGRRSGTREIVARGTPQLIVYRLEANRIIILRVRHGRQRWPVTHP